MPEPEPQRTRTDVEILGLIRRRAHRIQWARRLGGATLGLVVLAALAVPVLAEREASTVTAAGPAAGPARSPEPSTTTEPTTTVESTTTSQPQSTTTTAVAHAEGGEVGGTPAGTSTTTTAPPQPRYDWVYPELELVMAEVDGRIELGPLVATPDGCGQLVGGASGDEIDVEGMRYRRDGACTAALDVEWIFVPFEGPEMHLTVRYRDEVGTYRITRDGDALRVVLVEGDDTSAPVSEQWWRVPDDILLGTVHSTDESADPANERAQRVTDDLDQRLRDAGASRFERPEGDPILPGPDEISDPYIHDGVHDEAWRDHDGDAGDREYRRAYRTSLSDEELQQIADDAVANEQCVHVELARKSNYLVHDSQNGPVEADSPCS